MKILGDKMMPKISLEIQISALIYIKFDTY